MTSARFPVRKGINVFKGMFGRSANLCILLFALCLLPKQIAFAYPVVYFTVSESVTVIHSGELTVFARATSGSLAKIQATLGDEELFMWNGPAIEFSRTVTLTNSTPGRSTALTVMATDSDGNTNSATLQVNFPASASFELIEPQDDETVFVGEDVPIRILQRFDYGDAPNTIVNVDQYSSQWRLVGENPFDRFFRPLSAGTYTITVAIRTSSGETLPARTVTLHVVPFGAPEALRSTYSAGTSTVGTSQMLLATRITSRDEPRLQWLFNGDPIPGATNMMFYVTIPGPTEFGRYSLLADSAFGRSITPDILIYDTGTPFGGGLINFANLNATVDAPIFSGTEPYPLLGVQGRAQLFAGATLTNMVPVSAVTPTFSGYFDGGNIVLPNIAAGQTAFFQVYAWESSDSFSSANLCWKSKILQLTAGSEVAVPLTGLDSFRTVPKDGYTFGPYWGTDWTMTDIKAQAGSIATLHVDSIARLVTTGEVLPLSYQWYKNGKPLANATNSALTLASVSVDDVANYSALVTEGRNVSLQFFNLAVDAVPSPVLKMRQKVIDGVLARPGTVEVVATPGARYHIETSSDLSIWSPWQTVTFAAGSRSAEQSLPTNSIGNPMFFRTTVEP